MLWLGTRHFQPDVVHVGVVDPGVGTERRPIAFALNGSFYVGPDNGLFDMVIRESENAPTDIFQLHRPPGTSATFEGRDVFAPTAAAVVVTAVAVLPFALASGASGNELTQPMAVVILAGLVTATVVNLLIVPAICLAFGAAIPVGAEPLATEADEGTDTSPRQARGT